MKKWYVTILLLGISLLSGCNYSDTHQRTGLVYQLVVGPMDGLLHYLGLHLNHNYGLAIVIIVCLVRLILMPLMLHNQKQMAITSMKMKELQPKIEPIQQKMKAAATQQLKNEAYQELQQLYQQHQLNPLTTMFGCLPMLIQIPILLGLYATLKWPTSGGILSHPTFMWFHLTSPDSMMAMIAGFMYFVQSWLSARQMPKEQRMMGYVMMIVSPLFILYIAFQSPSALALYWSVNAASLMLQAIISQRQTHHIRQSKTM
ncbi:membrane protein insertase YidC [Staphylococcus lugdunensis]|uniref:Membrane protein insertase YidC n=1 Tax=Staphylococcus lugdunensis TaxID=28035 RepID=A0A4Q9WD63_STALU|nr:MULTISPECIES: membrane protein insertase YidC [Staphylococcus]AMG61863.1 hypothetical protein AL499_07895 [Staphylococcus lugdunensis]ARJ10377.1 hypothetical protein B7466_00935 [Staphylococcus lugdunensis]AST61154.1 hypothetical protein BFP67_10270 [Staphylococcus lugdunensis]ATG70112.1 hypothetical protein CPG32_10990 [Staphylococcus lugdunensis]ATN15359.1 hypothetical protein CRN64_08020 [Staphylococcus lugdunensis]